LLGDALGRVGDGWGIDDRGQIQFAAPRGRGGFSRPHHAGLPGTSTGQRPMGNDSPVLPACRQTQFVTMTLWVDAWQMQCCGEPFRLGSPVAWTVREADPDWLEAVLGAGAAPGVNGAEEHHGGIQARRRA
jgi:Family of unknown function (DUF6578)